MGDAAQMWSLRITQQVRHDTTGDAHGQLKRQRQRRLLAGGHVSCILQPVDCDQRGSKLPLALEVLLSIQPALGGTPAAVFFLVGFGRSLRTPNGRGMRRRARLDRHR